MGRFRFSITTLLVVITLLAAGLAAFVSQSEFGASGAYTGFVALLCLAVAGAALVKTGGRAFWIGFALFGWFYWGTQYEPNPELSMRVLSSFRVWPPVERPVRRPPLLTDDFLKFVEQNTTAKLEKGAAVNALWTNGAYYPGTIVQKNSAGQYLIAWSDGSAPLWVAASNIRAGGEYIHTTGQSLLGALFALGGGGLAFVVFGSRATQPPDKAAAQA
jgi:hypothetical protein